MMILHTFQLQTKSTCLCSLCCVYILLSIESQIFILEMFHIQIIVFANHLKNRDISPTTFKPDFLLLDN